MEEYASPKRCDLHCHSDASNQAAEVVLNAIRCPECYSDPQEVYAQAKRRGMDFVTLTDHDAIDGAQRIAHLPDVLVGEELTCWFPEDQCKLHLLLWGLSRDDHRELQALSRSVYDVAEYVERSAIAHAVAHPIYRQNDKLERWHLERLILLFKGFECLNGAHSPQHREAFEPLLDRLTAAQIQKLSETHALSPRWPVPWIKSRTAGSDDHGLLNIGKTWTEFPSTTTNPADVLRCLREGRCRPGGEAGSSAKLAHTFYSVAVRYYSRIILTPQRPANLPARLLQTVVGEHAAPRKSELAGMALKHRLRRLLGLTRRPNDDGLGLMRRLFLDAFKNRLSEHPELRGAMERGLPPLGEHEQMFRMVSSINRDVMQGISAAIDRSIDEASFTRLFEAIATILAQQFVLLPYYFAVFHQNKERHLLRQITGQRRQGGAATLRVGLFSDTFDEVNGVGRFIRDMGEQSAAAKRHFVVHTCAASPSFDASYRKNFSPLLSWPMPYYPQLSVSLPPVLEILEWADRQQFDAVHVSTPGPMGLCGWLVAQMLRVPLLGTYHTDFPAYVDHLTRDHRVVAGTRAYMKWFYGQMPLVFSRSSAYMFCLRDLGLTDARLLRISPGVNLEKFNPNRRDENLWAKLGVTQRRRVLYCGRVSVEKNLPLLVDVMGLLSRKRQDVALVVAGDGPYRQEMQRATAGLPVHFLGYQNDEQLGRLYASADLFVFPSRTDTLGQVVMEAQACGLPVLVSNEGGPKELVEDGVTGLVLGSDDAARWSAAIDQLLQDESARQRLRQAAIERMSGMSLAQTFEGFWSAHAAATNPADSDSDLPVIPRYTAASSS